VVNSTEDYASESVWKSCERCLSKSSRVRCEDTFCVANCDETFDWRIDAPQPSIRISGTKYKPMPGCPALETTMTLLIHISG
jgi:hypothetical protein